ncbi:glycosyltransferase family 1 protein [Nocardia farcinica]|uniref:GDP-mannose-dependent alpha-mannosyltransferase n=1 Tax=Nocardia farcinica TaxID=37329 RepID=A0A0H5PHU8_NOCFR|nr:glycosyltransferase family 1 protein [Nocardia farcinica]AXK87604.1 glycosyltransferase family 1 protein [Nocardia farcinica]MBF6252794.1 glycosyltransferase family 1 protein [Nocardia farcinica]MBF6264476.1 glycosyltransferase family 1 protein [Nocardia farcinica]MBF6283261.1 glycosyltransferase family 1 protein [Nocardia farcinica]MBF6292776.1 glycosyltransferase family 1 protein [Nocardia farcinica]
MRVAIVSESFLPNMNGVVNSVLRVLDHLSRHGHQALVIAPDTPRGLPPAPREHGGVPVYRVPAVMVPKISSLPVGLPQPGITDVIADFDADVVHLASPFLLGAGGLAAALRLDLPTVAVYQTDVAGFAQSYGLGLAGRAAWSWTRRIHLRATRTLAPSRAAAADLAAHGIPRVYRWGRGVDIARFTPSARSAALRERWRGGSDRLLVGFVGRLAPEKHVERLAVLADDPGLRLVIVGDGPERARLARLMPDAVFTGELGGQELATAYASLDVMVHAGEHETFCQGVQEALASGVPVIGPDAGGPRDLIAHCRNGYLLPVDRFEELLPSAVAALRDPGARARCGAAARKSVLHRTWPAICTELMDHYAAVTGIDNRLWRTA